MVRFGSLDNIYAHLDEVAKKSIRESLAANRELAELSRTLARIDTQAELSFPGRTEAGRAVHAGGL